MCIMVLVVIVNTFRWIEFVNHEEEPKYHPQRDATTRKECECALLVKNSDGDACFEGAICWLLE